MGKDVGGQPWVFDLTKQGEGIGSKDSWLRRVAFTTTYASDHIDLTAHGYYNGEGPIRLEEGNSDLPLGYAEDVDYYVIRVDADNFQLALTYDLAIAGTQVALTNDGTAANYILEKPKFPIPIFVRTIVIESGATGGTFEVNEKISGRSLTGSLSLAANSHEQIVVNRYVQGVYITAWVDGQILIYHGK